MSKVVRLFSSTVVALLVFSLSVAGLQTGLFAQQGHAPPHYAASPHPNPDQQQFLNDAASGTGLPIWRYTTTSSRDQKTYSGVMVGASPYTSNGTTIMVVPIVFTIGNTEFNPNKPSACAGGKAPTDLFIVSPFFIPSNWTVNGVNVGFTQYMDAFRRAEFWNVVQKHGGQYHTLLVPLRLPAVKVDATSHGQITAEGPCATLGAVDLEWWKGYVQGTLIPSLASKGVGPKTFPIFLTSNVLQFDQSTGSCCTAGIHGAYGSPVQTYAFINFDTTGALPGGQNTSGGAHEIGEWLDNPLVTNPTPGWLNPTDCQGNLEVGDFLGGEHFITRTMLGYRYDLQELAFFSWFYGAPSIGAGGKFSNNGTLTSDAGPVCGN